MRKTFYLIDLKHPIYAFVILAVVALALKGGAEFSNFVSALIGTAAAEVALFSKELWDKHVRHKFFDWFDIKIGQIGVVLGFICACFFM